MPAQSQQQQKLFGLALSVKRGETPRSDASEDVLGIVDSMTEKEIEDFASTSHKGLPKKVEQQIREIVREIMRERAISEIELSKAEMDKLHSDGEVEVDGEKVTYDESVNERLTNSDIKRMEGLHSYKKMDEALKSLVFIGKELYEEGFEKPEITEFILKKVQRRLFLQLKESTNEGVEPQIKKIAHFTGTRPDAVEDFVSKHALNITKLLKYVEKGGLPQRMELVSALAGRPNNPTQKKIIKMFNESINEGYSTEEKRIVMMSVRKIAKYMNVDLETAMNYVLGAGQELQRDIKKGKIKK